MTDCIDPSPNEVAKARSRNFLGVVIAVGVTAAIVSSVSSDYSDYSDSSDEDTRNYNINKENARMMRVSKENDLRERQEKAKEVNQEIITYDYYHGTHTAPVPVPID